MALHDTACQIVSMASAEIFKKKTRTKKQKTKTKTKTKGRQRTLLQ
jgi:hypothetical protein